MSDDGILLKGIAVMALLGIAVCILAAVAAPTASHEEGYTAMYMNTNAIDRNVTKNHTSVIIPFSVENREGGKANYHYSVSILYKDTIFHSGSDSWSEDLNVDEARDVVNGSFTLDDGKTRAVVVDVPFQSKTKWRNANVTIDLYKDGAPGVYRSLRLWAANKTT